MARAVVLDPDDPGFVFAVTNVFGLHIGDGAGELSWICPEVNTAVVDSQLGPTDAALVPLPDGSGRRIVLAGSGGLTYSEDGGCSWSRPQSPQTRDRISDLASFPGDPAHLLATTTAGGESNALLESRDGGVSWQPGEPMGRVFLGAVDVHPTTSRVHVLVYDRDNKRYEVHGRDGADEDAAWEVVALPERDEATWRLLAVDPDDDRRLYLASLGTMTSALVRLDTGAAEPAPEVLLERPGLVELTALARIGPERWLLGMDPRGGAISQDDGDTWTDLPQAPPIYCLVPQPDRVLACTSQLGGRAIVLESTDGGVSWGAWRRYDQTCRPLTCSLEASDSPCTEERWEVQIEEFREWGLIQDACGGTWPEPAPFTPPDLGPGPGADMGGDMGSDGGHVPVAEEMGAADDVPGAAPESSCGVVVQAGGGRAGKGLWWLVALMVVGLGRRRGRRSREGRGGRG